MPSLNRRIFLQGVGAAAAAPALPLTAATPAVATTPMQVMWASYYARVHNATSPAMIGKMLGVDAGVAQSLYGQLLSQGVIAAPTAGGISVAAKPITTHLATSPMRTLGQSIRTIAEEVMEAGIEEPANEEAQTPDET